MFMCDKYDKSYKKHWDAILYLAYFGTARHLSTYYTVEGKAILFQIFSLCSLLFSRVPFVVSIYGH